jgi:hypothetical protein
MGRSYTTNGEKRNKYIILAVNKEGKSHWEDLGVNGNDIKILMCQY